MEKTPAEQERDIKDLIRRARGNPDKTGTLRREALRRLIDLTHSPHSNVKILAAAGIRLFFNDFPELEEAAINAVYDLCEDHDPKVRLEGYSAITHVSKLQAKWVKRNADVLVQLLQSDEPEEVAVVKKALSEHLDMDPCVTLGVLCDQIVPPNELMDQEEQHIRNRLRSLVLSYLTGQARRTIVQATSSAEEVLINSLLAAIPKLNNADTEIIIKDILLSLPSYRPPSPKGHDLLKMIIEKAKMSFRVDFRLSDPSSFENMRFYLELATFLVSEEQAAPPIDLLRFYCTTLTGKMTLQKFFLEDQVLIICNTAKTLATCEAENGKSRDDATVHELPALRKQVVDACPILLELLADSGMTLPQSWSSCQVFLQGCLRRREESTWTVPAHLATSLHKIQATPCCEGGEKTFQDVQNLIRSLVQPALKPSTAKDTNILQGSSSSNISTPVKRNEVLHASLPERPSTACPSRRFTPTRPRAERDGSNGAAVYGTATPAISSLGKHNAILDDPLRLQKKTKQSGGGDSGPSLLSRMGSTVPNGAKDHISIDTPGDRQGGSQPGTTVGMVLDHDKREELSILGAASRTMEPKTPAFTLLDRIQDGGSPITEDDRARKRKKKGRAQR